MTKKLETPVGGSDERDQLPSPIRGREVVLHSRVVTDTGGGPDKTIFLSAPFLTESNYWLAAAYMHPPDDPGFAQLRQRAQRVGCPLIGVPDRGPLDRSVLRTLLGLCRHYQVRIWHGHDYKSNMLGLALRPFWDMKLVSTVHGWVKRTARTPFYYAIDRWCLPYYHHVICVSDDLVERVGSLGVPPERLSLIHNAIDDQQYQRHCPPQEAAMRRQRSVPAGRIVISAVGRLSPEKAFGFLIRAVHELLGEGFDVELWIAGKGESREELSQLIRRLHLTDRVQLLGFVDDTIGMYEASDLFVLSSLREGLPNVLLEAMAMSVPVVSTRVAGVPQLIDDGQNGLLVDVGQPEQLTAAIRTALLDEPMRQQLAEAGRAVIENRYSFAQRMAKVRAIYDHLLGDRHRPQQVESGHVAPAQGQLPA